MATGRGDLDQRHTKGGIDTYINSGLEISVLFFFVASQPWGIPQGGGAAAE